MRRRIPPAIVLFVLAPAVGELLSGSTSLDFCSPCHAMVWKRSQMSDTHRFALASGALGFFILHAPFLELSNPTRPDNTAGMSLVGLFTLIGLVWLWRQLVQRQSSDQETLPSI